MKNTPQPDTRVCEQEGFVASKKVISAARKERTDDRIISPVARDALVDEHSLYERVRCGGFAVECLSQPLSVRSTQGGIGPDLRKKSLRFGAALREKSAQPIQECPILEYVMGNGEHDVVIACRPDETVQLQSGDYSWVCVLTVT